MGREVRKVPPNWEHPQTERHGQTDLQPMFNRHIDDAMKEWLSDFDRIRGGNLSDIEVECYGSSSCPLAAWMADESPPDLAYHRPWRDEEATWFQVWETVSEGTPITPPFATREELIAHLVAHGTTWDDGRGYSRVAAEAFVREGWAPSMVVVNGKVASGINVPLALIEAERKEP